MSVLATSSWIPCICTSMVFQRIINEAPFAIYSSPMKSINVLLFALLSGIIILTNEFRLDIKLAIVMIYA